MSNENDQPMTASEVKARMESIKDLQGFKELQEKHDERVKAIFSPIINRMYEILERQTMKEAIAAGNEAVRRLKILVEAAKYALPTISNGLAHTKLEEAIREAEGDT